jgi:transcriptional regulator with XRE-family HTH domain
MATTGERIRSLREEAGIKQADLAKMLGVSGSVMSDYESGNLQVNNARLRIIADLFKTTTDYLLLKRDDRTDASQDDEETRDMLRVAINKGQIKEIVGKLLEMSEDDQRTIVQFIEFLDRKRTQ